jgi:hypothetical protein
VSVRLGEAVAVAQDRSLIDTVSDCAGMLRSGQRHAERRLCARGLSGTIVTHGAHISHSSAHRRQAGADWHGLPADAGKEKATALDSAAPVGCLNGADASDPPVSPVYGSLAGLPPLLIQAGSHEIPWTTRSGSPPGPPTTTSRSPWTWSRRAPCVPGVRRRPGRRRVTYAPEAGVLGADVTADLKSRDLFVDVYHEMFGIR